MPNQSLKASSDCFELVKFFEGCKLTAYKDSAGIWTIGIGSATTGGFPVKPGMTIDMATAEKWFLQELSKVEAQIKAEVKVQLKQSQFDALCSFVYNLGIGSLKASTLLKLLNASAAPSSVAGEFPKWNKARVNGVLTELSGLTKRRRAEALLFLGEDWRTDEHKRAGVPAPKHLATEPAVIAENAGCPVKKFLREMKIT